MNGSREKQLSGVMYAKCNVFFDCVFLTVIDLNFDIQFRYAVLPGMIFFQQDI
jgi:hypothetical protein